MWLAKKIHFGTPPDFDKFFWKLSSMELAFKASIVYILLLTKCNF